MKKYGGSSKIRTTVIRNSSLGHLPKEEEYTNLKRYLHLCVHGNIVFIIDKICVLYMHSGIFFSHRIEEKPCHLYQHGWAFLRTLFIFIFILFYFFGGHYCKWKKSEKDKYWWSHLAVESKNKTELMDTESTLMVARSEGYIVWMEWMKVVRRHKLPVINKFWGCNVQHSNYS